ncbi:hypothetical protein [Alteribacillus iranensis]|uniref:Uncharacterized protein n=1 Tax=Alteribacillus iranensis TaxID=930128 RepID=A0A1I2FC09_9BACI|nr:hypothetical protein [Alteribacillus iranensis]SFF02307.1 hypothetical protein SAMN05192532_11038 [Alteribacillus iranensis]
MIKKWLYMAMTGIFAAGVLTACGGGDTEQQEQPAEGPTVDPNPALEEEHPQMNQTEEDESVEDGEGENGDEGNDSPTENSETGTSGGAEEGSMHGQENDGDINTEEETDNPEEEDD